MRGLLAVWMRWFPLRTTVFAGDGGFASHELAGFVSRHPNRLTLVSKFPPQAVLHDRPPQRMPGQSGRPRVVGKRLPNPQEVVASSNKRRRLTVKWYGGGTRRIEVVSGVGHWYRQGQGLVPVRWVYVRDLTGDHRDEYFFSTEIRMSVKRIVETFVGRWDIEVTFEEMREHLGLETTRGRCRNTVLRVEPCLFGLYSLIVYWFVHLPRRNRETEKPSTWFGWARRRSPFPTPWPASAITLGTITFFNSPIKTGRMKNSPPTRKTPSSRPSLLPPDGKSRG